jgi:hypothetical protein
MAHFLAAGRPCQPFSKGEQPMAKSSAGDKWVMGILGSIIVTVVSKLVYDWIQEQRRI